MGVTPLMACAVSGLAPAVRRLLALGAPPDAQDELGNTALSVAAMKGHVDVVEELLAGRANVNLARKVCPIAPFAAPPGSAPRRAVCGLLPLLWYTVGGP